MKKTIFALLGLITLYSCADETSQNVKNDENVAAPSSALKSKTNDETLVAYKKAANKYYFYKDNKEHDQREVNKLIIEEATKLLEDYGDPSPESYDKHLIKTDEELIITKAFERFIELGKTN